MNIHLRRVAIGFTVAAAFAVLVLWIGIDGGDEPAPTPAAGADAATAMKAVPVPDRGDGYTLLSRSWSDAPVTDEEPTPEEEPLLNVAAERDRKFAEEASKRWQNLEIAVGR